MNTTITVTAAAANFSDAAVKVAKILDRRSVTQKIADTAVESASALITGDFRNGAPAALIVGAGAVTVAYAAVKGLEAWRWRKLRSKLRGKTTRISVEIDGEHVTQDLVGLYGPMQVSMGGNSTKGFAFVVASGTDRAFVLLPEEVVKDLEATSDSDRSAEWFQIRASELFDGGQLHLCSSLVQAALVRPCGALNATVAGLAADLSTARGVQAILSEEKARLIGELSEAKVELHRSNEKLDKLGGERAALAARFDSTELARRELIAERNELATELEAALEAVIEIANQADHAEAWAAAFASKLTEAVEAVHEAARIGAVNAKRAAELEAKLAALGAATKAA